MNNKKSKIRSRILEVISIMLLSTLTLIWGIFNIAVRQYIQSSAVSQIDSAYNNMRVAMEQMEQMEQIEQYRPVPQLRGGDSNYVVRGNLFRIEANMFFVDEGYNLLGEQILTDETPSILYVIRDRNLDLGNLRNVRIVAGEGVYYVSAFRAPDPRMDDNAYLVIYADVTGLSNFAVSINTFLVVLVCVMFIAAVFVTFFLSNSITLPIQKLCTLAANIGRGDFTPTEYDFMDIEFADLNSALNKSAKQLDLYDSEQKAFFQNVSHELRTPLMSIQCYAEGISFGLMEPKEASETILLETARLNEMVKDLLYISKIDNITHTYTSVKIDLIETVRECAGRQQAVADKKQVCVSFDFDAQPVICNCVGELISRAVENLISNAIRYASSEIVLSCRNKAGQAVICVADDGPGIEAETMPHIFERFYKGTDGNHGIGLSIVKSIVEQHCGNVKAENMENGGAKFTIALPIEK